jgi:hypothetical protein
LDQQADWEEEYEYLRQEALKPGAPRGHGLALFLSRGMKAWLEALTALKLRPVAQKADEQSSGVPSIARSDLMVLLAGMVLSCIGEETHEHSV